MTEDEVVAQVTHDTGEEDAALLLGYVRQAESMILNRRYFRHAQRATATFPDEYRQTQARLATALWAKRGAEGESAHNENGVSRTYADPASVLSEVTPYVGFGDVS